jgi:probable HAF family extracellular repeat protein
LSFPSTTGSVDLNNRGQVVFTGTKSNGHDQAYLWQGGVSTSLGDIGGVFPQSTAYAVNERGEVTGTINGPAGARAYRWRSGVFTVLDVLPGDDLSESFGINDQGLVMGLSAPEIDGNHAVIWR